MHSLKLVDLLVKNKLITVAEAKSVLEKSNTSEEIINNIRERYKFNHEIIKMLEGVL